MTVPNREHIDFIVAEQKAKGWVLEQAFPDGQLLFHLESDPVKKMVLLDPDTGLLNPAATAGGWTNGANAYSNGSGITALTADAATQNFANYGITFTGTVFSVDGIIVRVRANSNGTGTNTNVNVNLSWNTGTTKTSNKNTGALTSTLADYNLGGATDTWGRTWASTDFTNTNFKVLVTTRASTGRRIYYDWVAVQVYYTNQISVTKTFTFGTQPALAGTKTFTFGTEPQWGTTNVTMPLAPATYTVTMPVTFGAYTFRKWEDNSTNPVRNVALNADTTITAYYVVVGSKTFTFGTEPQTGATPPTTTPSTGDAWLRKGSMLKPIPLSKEELRLIRDYLRLKLE
jgi:hypothetical protein